jgi:hypothetical protein
MAELERLPDPLIASPVDVREDMAEHVRTYDRFLRFIGWFLAHIPFLLLGLYAMTLGGQPIGGAMLIGLGLVILIIGVGRAVTY